MDVANHYPIADTTDLLTPLKTSSRLHGSQEFQMFGPRTNCRDWSVQGDQLQSTNSRQMQ